MYRINGCLVVANSIEGAINTWREWNQPNCPDIRSIERMGNDSYQTVGDDALVIAEELCGDMTNELTEELARKSEEIEKLTYDLKKAEAYTKTSPRPSAGIVLLPIRAMQMHKTTSPSAMNRAEV